MPAGQDSLVEPVVAGMRRFSFPYTSGAELAYFGSSGA